MSKKQPAKKKSPHSAANQIIASTNFGIKRKAMIEALKATFGNISEACEKVGIDRQTHYNWLKAHPEYKEAYESIEESNIDFAEGKLRELIAGAKYEALTHKGHVVELRGAPNVTAINSYLKAKARNRGYGEKLEIDHNIGALDSITFVIKGKDK